MGKDKKNTEGFKACTGMKKWIKGFKGITPLAVTIKLFSIYFQHKVCGKIFKP